jgi:hypothetical protein
VTNKNGVSIGRLDLLAPTKTLLITINYSAIANLLTSQITRALEVFSVFTSRILATDL